MRAAPVDIVRAATLLIAAGGMGLMAGVFGVYANSIMPGLRDTDDRTFVASFQSIDRAIINPVFLTVFMGTLIATGLAMGLHLPTGHRSPLPWIVAAFALYLAVVVITIAVNVPLNDAIKAAGLPDEIAELGEIRTRFDEARWVRWNAARTVMTLAGFGCLLTAIEV